MKESIRCLGNFVKQRIFHIGSIDEKVLIEFSNMKGIGKTRVKDVLNKLETLNIFLDLIKDNPIIDIDKFKIGKKIFKRFENKSYILTSKV